MNLIFNPLFIIKLSLQWNYYAISIQVDGKQIFSWTLSKKYIQIRLLAAPYLNDVQYRAISIQQKNNMYNSTKLLQRSEIYLAKKGKEPDHLLNLVQRIKKSQQTENTLLDQDEKDRIRKRILQKRIDAILKIGSSKPSVSNPVPFVKKKWVSPLEQRNINEDYHPYAQLTQQRDIKKEQQRQQMKQVLKILDINKHLKYFGEYLQVEIQGKQRVQVAHITEHQSRMSYLKKKFQLLEKNMKPRLCVFNYPLHQKIAFVNYLQNDEFFQNIMRKNDTELVKMLIQTLMDNGNFTLTSYIKFYNIFVWQSADKKEQIQFVGKLLMKELPQKSIVDVSRIIDLVCKKINLQNFNKSLQNFNEVMKKLMYGQDYEFSNRKEYYLTRKALVQSLQMNEECISIFINIFYSA